MKKFSIPLALTLLSACSSPPEWRKQGVSRNDAESALARCENDSLKSKPQNDFELNKLIQSCMKGQGYRLR